MSQIIMSHATAEDAEVPLPRGIESVKSVASILGMIGSRVCRSCN